MVIIEVDVLVYDSECIVFEELIGDYRDEDRGHNSEVFGFLVIDSIVHT